MWKIREKDQSFDYSKAYDDKSTSFSLQIFHGGKFSKSPNMEYKDGEITFIDDVSLYDITLRMLDEMVKRIGEGYKVIEIYVEKKKKNDEHSSDDIVDKNNPMHEINEVVDMGNFHGCVRNGRESESESESEDLEVDHDNFDSQSDEETTVLKRAGNIVRSKRKRKTIGVDASVNPFCIGQLIEDKDKLNEMVKSYSLASRREIYILKNELLKYRLICLGTTPSLVSSGKVQVSLHKISRAKKLAQQKIHGHYQEQYTLLRAYCEELLKANPGSTIKIDVEPFSNPSSSTRQFRRIYICLHAMKRGFKMYSNNGIYPVAYSLVEAETTESWAWFLDLLKDDLDISTNSNFTFISDRQKGLIPALKGIQSTAKGPLTPVAETMFNAIKAEASQLKVLMVDATKYQVSGTTSQCVVNIHLKTCSCRRWELTGMPCKHAVAAIWNMSENSISAGIPEAWVSEVYWLDTWKKAYLNVIQPITSSDLWTPTTWPTTLIPPKHHKPIGRPRKMRKKSLEEVQAGFAVGGKMTRKGTTNKRSKCGNMGHNCRSCKGQGGTQSESQAETQSQVEGVTQSDVVGT
ncbi:hypothetical protein QVD17_12148 [Tagetes erecta]|uniref:SWIM-type domain-containing protein n=1 Tax=Tagetes erecta TaxID=13708 RepID=A0AAD8L1X9_TARER|nr:hypothetical protein QVD17_12148 [Tagetes erecta]